jgi:curved DNA-binding protein CbpA
MQSQAFQTLGIEPTIDGRAIRDAFVRIARIYHPDRFAGQPEDVRLEAERRMKEASAAYELLKVSNTAITSGQSVFNDKDLQERTRAYRKAMEERQREDDKNRARWARWEAIEKQAREKAEQESALALAAMREVRGEQPQPVRTARPVSAPQIKADPPKLTTKTPSSALKARIDAARKQEKEVKRTEQRKRSEEVL